MFKKLSASIFALALVAGVFAPAQAQDTIGLYLDDAVEGLRRFGNLTPGTPFDIKVITKTDESSCAAEANRPRGSFTSRVWTTSSKNGLSCGFASPRRRGSDSQTFCIVSWNPWLRYGCWPLDSS